jgi:hypothetical protein
VRWQRLPSVSRGCPWATSFALAASCALARVCTRPQRVHQSLTRASPLNIEAPPRVPERGNRPMTIVPDICRPSAPGLHLRPGARRG